MLRILRQLSLPDNQVTAMNWGAYGLAVGDSSGGMHLWTSDETTIGGLSNLAPDSVVYDAHTFAVCSVCWLDRMIISCSLDGSIMIADSTDRKNVKQIGPNIEDPTCVVALTDRNVVVVGDATGKVTFLTNGGDEVAATVAIFEDDVVTSVAVHAISDKVFVLSTKELVMVDATSFVVEKRCGITAECCTCCALSDDGYSCAVTATDGTCRVVDIVAFREVGSVVFEEAELNKVCSIDFGKRFVVVSSEGRVGLFDVRKMTKERGLLIGKKPLIAMAIREGDKKAAVGGGDKNITLVDLG